MPFQWAKQIVPAAEMTEGPYYGHGGPDRSDIREGLPGLDFHLTIKVIDIASGGPLAGLKVDLWHCDAQGYYSGYQFDPDGQPLSVEYQLPSNDESYLRGSQTTNAAGLVTFLTLFPGWYATRTPHIHFKVFTGEACILTSQLYLPEQSLGHVYATQADYYRKVERDTFNKTDIVLAKAPESIEGCWIELQEIPGGLEGSSLVAIDLNARSTRREIPAGFRPPLGGIPHAKPVR
ncbi:MAG TPA: protocatechuate dioxygenase [Bradyrhizobium sp.]|jgi:protocatechuate 3,4-dioxygenase beta subunit|nr:protocatechuate dioxygenase [Bradyrhizobium sp.]